MENDIHFINFYLIENYIKAKGMKKESGHRKY